MDKKYLSIKEASSILNVTKLTLRNWDKTGKLNALRHPINNYRVYIKEEIDNIIHKIESGYKPIKHSRIVKNINKEEPIVYKLKVIHMKD